MADSAADAAVDSADVVVDVVDSAAAAAVLDRLTAHDSMSYEDDTADMDTSL